jgi:archaellin
MKMIKRSKRITYVTRCTRMFPSTLFIKIFSVSVALVVFVIISGCITAPSGPDKTVPVTTLPTTTVTPSPIPSPTTYPVPSSADIQLRSNVYALSSNPQTGIDTIYFSIGLTSLAPEIDLTTMNVVVSTPGSAPVTLVHSTQDSTTTFSTTSGNNAVTTLGPRQEVQITFRVKPIPSGSKVYIEVQPAAGAVLPISGTVPEMLSSVNILQ